MFKQCLPFIIFYTKIQQSCASSNASSLIGYGLNLSLMSVTVYILIVFSTLKPTVTLLATELLIT